MAKVFISRSIPEEILTRLREVSDVKAWDGDGPVPSDLLARELRSCEGLLSMLTDRIDRGLLEEAPSLRIVSQMAVGVDNIDLEACSRLGIAVGHTPDVLTETVADTAFALMAAIIRRLPEGEAIVRSGGWGPWDPWNLLGGELHRAALGIVGMGRIGQAVVRRAIGFDMTVLYASPSPKPGVTATHVGLSELLASSDIVLIAADLNQKTRGLIDLRQLQQMKPEAYLINIARGGLINTDALVTALASGILAGVALDVTDPEPLPSSHPLLEFPRCLVVPHIGSASVRARRKMADLAVSNLIAGLDGKPLPAAVAHRPALA